MFLTQNYLSYEIKFKKCTSYLIILSSESSH